MSAPEDSGAARDLGVSLALVWHGPRELTVDTTNHPPVVTAHAQLSEANVLAACAHLEPELAAKVMAAWREQLTDLPPQRGGG